MEVKRNVGRRGEFAQTSSCFARGHHDLSHVLLRCCLGGWGGNIVLLCVSMSTSLNSAHISAHIGGLSALYIHENLWIGTLMAFVRYMAFAKDKLHPNKAYVCSYL